MKESTRTRWMNQLIFIAPAVILFLTFVIVPFLFSVVTSFSKWNGVSNNFQWIGLSNYLKAFGDKDFINSFIYTIKNTVAVTVLANGIGLLFALALTSKIRGSSFFRASLVLPNILSGIVLGFIWKFIFTKGFPALGELTGIKFLQLSWLGTPATAFWGIVIVSVWQMAGYVMLVYVAGILSVPDTVIESAYMDGAKNHQLIRYIIFPYLKSSFLICFFWTISKSLVTFDLPFSLTQGGPYKSTESLAINIYHEAFEKNNYGYGSAKSILFFCVVIIISALQVYLNNRKETEEE
ncbi:MAG: carbohydrate ABC transporter permease [Coprococcus sp.]